MSEDRNTLTSLKQEASSVFLLASDPWNNHVRKRTIIRDRAKKLGEMLSVTARGAHAECACKHARPSRACGRRKITRLQQLQTDGQNVTEGSHYTAKQTISNTKAAKNFPIQSLKGSAESSLGQSVAVKTTITDTKSISTRECRARDKATFRIRDKDQTYAVYIKLYYK